MLRFAFIALGLLTIGAAQADTIECYQRVYSAAHLQANPKQKVRSIELKITDQGNAILTNVEVQTRAAINGNTLFNNNGGCERITGMGPVVPTYSCQFYYAGGVFTVGLNGKLALLTATEDLQMLRQSDNLPGDLNLAVGYDNGIYQLSRVNARACD